MNTEKTLLRIEIKQDSEGFFVYILDNNYNIIHKTIYNEELAKKIIEEIEKEI